MDPSSRLHKHIAIVTALDDLSTSPSILNAVHLLVEAGYQVDIIARGNHCSMPNDEGWKYGVYFHLSPWSVRKGIPGLVALRHLLIIKILWTLRPIAVIAIQPGWIGFGWTRSGLPGFAVGLFLFGDLFPYRLGFSASWYLIKVTIP